jgi:uncharacterized protein (DUF1499 family)
VAFALLAAAALGYAAVRLWAASAPPPATLGLAAGRLAPCPRTPNCVGSEDPSPAHRMAPIPLTGSADAARRHLLEQIASRPRARVVATDSTYVHAEFRSRVFGFVDDVEFRLDPTHGVLHFRSASRLGRGDLGANRRRMETLTTTLRDGSPDLRH